MNPPHETYLDHAASAPLRPEAREAVVRALDAGPGNASAAHAAGRRLRRILGDAREQVAALVAARPDEVVFTSGTTESNRLAVRGLLGPATDRRALVLSAAAHEGLRALGRALADDGVDVRSAGCGAAGHVDVADVVRAAQHSTGEPVVALGAVQSVTGALQPIEGVRRALPEARLHIDAAQAVGRVPVSLRDSGAATMALSSHKIGGPQGVGALLVRGDVRLHATDGAASQERGRRAGTEAVALAAGFGAAARATLDSLSGVQRRHAELLLPLVRWVRDEPRATLVSTPPSVAGIALVRLTGCPGEAVLAALDARGVRVSTGTACASGASTPPHVLLSSGWTPRAAAECIRVSVGWRTTEDDVLHLVTALRGVVPRVRAAFGDGEKNLS